ncbi:MAG TPA: DUF3570 domain-containing protein [Dongiaceae bacterium]|nr:DUF3570 domain-containing protein [Dongiaceae bacterium]
MTTTKKRNPLAALTGAALALPAIAQLAHADSAPVKTEVGYRYSQYQEDDLSQSQILIGSPERYDVDNHAFRLVTPLNAQLGLTVDASYETMSGASAYGVAEDAQGEPKLIMTGASIDDRRNDVSASLRHYRDNGSIAVSVGWSDEKDYTAYNAALEAEQSSADRLTTYSGGIGYSSDTIEPVQEAGINRPDSEDKSTINGFAAITRILSASWQVQGGLFAGFNDGYLSDAYKARDIRPDERQSFGAMARSRYFMPDLQAALHADYRYYSDDWGIQSHTLEFAWHQSLTKQLRLVPLLRYYSQSQADFYVDNDSISHTGDQSSDYRLSPFGAIAYGLGLVYEETSWRLTANVERYDSEGDLALESVDRENPMLVSYTLLAVGVDYRF